MRRWRVLRSRQPPGCDGVAATHLLGGQCSCDPLSDGNGAGAVHEVHPSQLTLLGFPPFFLAFFFLAFFLWGLVVAPAQHLLLSAPPSPHLHASASARSIAAWWARIRSCRVCTLTQCASARTAATTSCCCMVLLMVVPVTPSSADDHRASDGSGCARSGWGSVFFASAVCWSLGQSRDFVAKR